MSTWLILTISVAMLSAVDGCNSADGRILIMTSNDKDSLDAALLRPGRCDLFVRYERATHQDAEALFKHFFSDVAQEPFEAPAGTHEETPALT